MRKILLLILINIIITVSETYSQEKGEITGRVIDKNNQTTLSGASISLIKDKIIITGTESDLSGFFILKDVPVGEYTLKFSYTGFSTLILDNITVNTGSPTDVLAQLNIITTEEIEVQEERFLLPSDLSNSFKSLQYEEIRRSPGGFEDIGRVVQTLPGVSFVNDGRNDLIVRGGSPSENLFLVDNSSVPNINHFGSQGTTGGPVSIINLDFIREANFLTGGFSARYGDKLSSVLDLKLREGSRIKFSGDVNLSATGFGAVLEGPVGSDKKGSWLFSARRSYLDLVFRASGFGFVPEYSSVQLKGVYDFGKKNSLVINAYGILDKVTFNNDDEENRQDNEGILKNNQWGYVNNYEWKTLLSKKSFILFNLGRTYGNFDYSGRDSLFNEVFKNNSEEGETTIKTEYFLTPKPSTQLQFGAGWKFVKFTNNIIQQIDTSYYINPDTGERYVFPALAIDGSTLTGKAFAFTQLTQTFFGRLKFNLGLRYDYFEYLNNKNYVSPRASVLYPFSSKFNLNFSYGIFYQSPSYIWLVANEQNRALNDIKAEHYIAGAEYLFTGDLRMTLEAYYKNYSDYPVSTLRPYLILANNGGNFEQTDQFGLEPLVSAGTGYSQGIEIFLQKVLTTNYYGTLSISLFEAKYKALDGIERESDFNNRFLMTIVGGYNFGQGWDISSKFRFTGGRPFTPINPVDGTMLASEYNTARLPDYSSLDVRLEKNFNFSKWALVTYIDIQNILNKKNISGYTWNKYTNRIEANESIGILPTIGINAMF